eukprot:157040_1
MAEANHHSDESSKFRSFVIAYDQRYGYLLLSAYKKKKGVHYQLPGGHIDKSELNSYSLEEASKIAANRELFEETGIKITDMSRLIYLNFGIKNRTYFGLLLDETDSLNNKNTKSLDDTQHFYLKLSHEHTGFIFEKDIKKAIVMIKQHSGGKNSEALAMCAKMMKKNKKRKKKHKKDNKDKKKKHMTME